MRGCLTVWALLALLTGGCAVFAMVSIPNSARMLDCTDCPILEVGNPDAVERTRLEPYTRYVLFGCHSGEVQETQGYEWHIIGNARQYQDNDPHEVRVRVGLGERRDGRDYGVDGPPVLMWPGACYRMLVRYDQKHDHGIMLVPFVAVDSIDQFDD